LCVGSQHRRAKARRVCHRARRRPEGGCREDLGARRPVGALRTAVAQGLIVVQWSIPLDQLARTTGEELQVVARKAALTVLQFAVQASPVDTGRFKGNWQVTYGAPAAGLRD